MMETKIPRITKNKLKEISKSDEYKKICNRK
jgi:hypothetical protein